MAERQITGRHVLLGFIAFFAVIILVNVTMAYNAVSTFPGLEVKNGYIASQTFDERRAEQEALGWTVNVEHSDGELAIQITDAEGKPVQVGKISALVGRPTENRDDFSPELSFNGHAYWTPVELGKGKWVVHLKATSLEGVEFQQRLNVHVKS